MKFFTVIFLLLYPLAGVAKPMYKCKSSGAVAYQFKPCDPGQAAEVVGESENTDNPVSQPIKSDYSMTVGELSVQYDHTRYNGDVEFVYKFRVSNNTGVPINRFFSYQAIDFAGFELCRFSTLVKVESNSTQMVTGTYFMPVVKWEKIYKWQAVN